VAADNLLAALKGNYGVGQPWVDDVNTVRGLLSFCKKWTEGLVHADELNDPCLAMAGRLRAGANEMEADLRTNPAMADEMRAPITRTMEAYRAISDVLEEFGPFARDDNIDDFLDNLEVFEEERQAVLDAQEQIQFQLSGKVPLCPRCGSSGEEERCDKCLLTRLYPDPSANRARLQQARLPGLYGKVFRAYLRVLGGERSLNVLWEALGPLEEHLETLLSTRKQLRKRISSGKLSGRRRLDARAAESLLSDAQEDLQVALRGVERMRAVEHSLRMSDLSRGWEDIFHAAQGIEMVAARIRRRLGDEDEAESGPSVPPTSGDDLVSFSGE
jgi:hypothetical protein